MNETSFFHEFKNAQINGDYTFAGKGEVTVFYEDGEIFEIEVNGIKLDFGMPYTDVYTAAETYLEERSLI